MKIGIVSAHKHCKNHLLALREDGYDVHGLGGSPTSIPPSYDALIVRAASCSHGGFNTAVAWGRETGRPLIHENGLSGIRRELTSLVEGESPVAVQECPQDIYEVLRDSAEAFLFARPDDPPEVAEKALKTVLHQYPEHVSACSSMIPSILAQLYVPSPEPEAEEMTTTTEEEDSMGTKTLPTHRGDFPIHHAWTKVHSVALLTTAYVEATALIDGLSASSLRAFRDAWDSCEKDHSVDMRSALRGQEGGSDFWTEGNESIFLSKPRLFAMFVYLLLDEDHIPAKRTFSKTYKSLTGKTNDTRLPDAVSWYLNRPEPLNMENPTTRKKKRGKQATTRRVEPTPITNPVQSVVDQNTESILEVMEDVASMKSRLEAVLKANAHLSDRVRRLESRLEEAVSAGFDPRYQAKLAHTEQRIQAIFTTQMQNHKNEINHLLQQTRGSGDSEWEARIESRITALEAPASLQQTGVSNPFASLEQVKATLKAAGFTGSLTLTIE